MVPRILSPSHQCLISNSLCSALEDVRQLELKLNFWDGFGSAPFSIGSKESLPKNPSVVTPGLLAQLSAEGGISSGEGHSLGTSTLGREPLGEPALGEICPLTIAMGVLVLRPRALNLFISGLRRLVVS